MYDPDIRARRFSRRIVCDGARASSESGLRTASNVMPSRCSIVPSMRIMICSPFALAGMYPEALTPGIFEPPTISGYAVRVASSGIVLVTSASISSVEIIILSISSSFHPFLLSPYIIVEPDLRATGAMKS